MPLYRLMAEECDAKVGLGGRSSSSGPAAGLRAGAAPSDISEAEKVLEEHFGSAAAAPQAAAVEGGMSSAEADEILRQHFSAR